MKNLSKKRKDLLEQFAREEIYEATLEVMKTDGSDGLTMQKVADKAGVATGTLYNYFKSKDDLLIYVDTQICEQINNKLEDIVKLDLAPGQKLKTLVNEIYEFAEENMQIFAILEQSQICLKIPKENHKHRVKRMLKTYEQIVTEGIEKNEFRNVSPIVASELFKAATVGLIIFKAEIDIFDPVNDPKNLLDLFYRYLGYEQK